MNTNNDLYPTFRSNVLYAIRTGRAVTLNEQELTLLIPTKVPMDAARLRRPFKVRFITEYPEHARLFGPLRVFKGRGARRSPAELDTLFEQKFNFNTALALMMTMRDYHLTVHQSSGRLVAFGVKLVLTSAMISRYGIYIHDRWGVGVRPSIKGSKFCQMEEVC